jgi:hypothetical protein
MSDGQRDPEMGHGRNTTMRTARGRWSSLCLVLPSGLFSLNGCRSEHAHRQATVHIEARPGRRAADQARQHDPAWAAARQGPCRDHASPSQRVTRMVRSCRAPKQDPFRRIDYGTLRVGRPRLALATSRRCGSAHARGGANGSNFEGARADGGEERRPPGNRRVVFGNDGWRGAAARGANELSPLRPCKPSQHLAQQSRSPPEHPEATRSELPF